MILLNIFRSDCPKQGGSCVAVRHGGAFRSGSWRATPGWQEVCRALRREQWSLSESSSVVCCRGCFRQNAIAAPSSQSFLEGGCSPQNILGGSYRASSVHGQRPWAREQSGEWIILMSAEFGLHPGGEIKLMESLQSFRAWFSAVVNQCSSV